MINSVSNKKKIPADVMKFLLKAQTNEITEEMIYNKLADLTKDKNNKKILKIIASEEKKHHDIWKLYTGAVVKPNKFRVLFFVMISKVFGLGFGIKLMER